MPYRKLLTQVYDANDPLIFMGKASQTVIGESLSILVWNSYKAKRIGWRADFLSLISDKDLVILQESVLTADDNGIFEKSRRFEWIMARSHQYLRSQMITGLKTGAVAAASAQQWLYSPDQEPLLHTSKLLLATTYPLQNSVETLLVVNVHAINFVKLKKYTRHIQQILAVIRPHLGPIILAGDFNCWNAGRFELLIASISEAGLIAAPLERENRWQHLNRHLDHIFYRGLDLISAETLSDIHSSDHFPLVAEFKLQSVAL